MFEEVPRTRRGLGVSRLAARRIVLGPFVVGGGVVLAAVGGSVAVAATMFTASTIRANDVPPRPHPVPISVSSSASSASHHAAHPSPSTSPITASATPAPSTGPASSSSPASSHLPSSESTPSASKTKAGSPSASATPTLPTSSAGPTPTPSPAGNAMVWVSGWNGDHKQLLFEFATVSKGIGPQHSDVYSIASPKQYTATLASDLRIISGGQLCPPAGSSCTVAQLVAGTATGFYAELAIDPSSAVHEVAERDNVSTAAPPVTPSPTPTATTAFGPAPTATPTAGTTP